jgi:23S rRNA (cytosine1962-C5)-methyltransferase
MFMKKLLSDIISTIDFRQQAGFAVLNSAYRLLNGFYESEIDLVIDRYASTLVFFNHADPPESLKGLIPDIQAALLENLPGVECVLIKIRRSEEPLARRGVPTFGETPAKKFVENGINYALDLRLNQDASFYLDTRQVRRWLKDHSSEWDVLNCFAYTGSLGASALAGGARRVVQLDLSRKFLSLAKETYSLNNLTLKENDFLVGDFFRLTGRMRKEGIKFDCVILDAPLFSTGRSASIDTAQDTARLINKVRPLVKDEGTILCINNSLFLSGKEYLDTINKLSADGCIELEEIIPVPEDITGFPQTILRKPPVDPAPFNHPTKITLLRVKNKNRVAPV